MFLEHALVMKCPSTCVRVHTRGVLWDRYLEVETPSSCVLDFAGVRFLPIGSSRLQSYQPRAGLLSSTFGHASSHQLNLAVSSGKSGAAPLAGSPFCSVCCWCSGPWRGQRLCQAHAACLDLDPRPPRFCLALTCSHLAFSSELPVLWGPDHPSLGSWV